MPRVSVILPVYNGAKYLADAVNSIVEQTFADWELIAIDDGSGDGSAELLKELASRDDRIQMVENAQNLGLGATLNKGFGMARGEYIAIQEQDDISMPDRLAREVAVLDARPEVVVASGVAEFLGDRQERLSLFPGLLAYGGQYPQDAEEMFRYLYIEQCKVVNAGCMMRRAVLQDWPKPFNETARMSIDWEFFLRVARKYRFYGLNDIVVRMRRGGKRASITRNRELRFSEARRCIREMRAEFQHGPEPRITFEMWRKAMAIELDLEARTWGRLKGLWRLLAAWVLWPRSERVWQTLRHFAQRAIARVRSSSQEGPRSRYGTPTNPSSQDA